MRVPVLFSVPNEAYHSAPFFTIAGRVASVSQLLLTVGPPYRPITAGNGGFKRG